MNMIRCAAALFLCGLLTGCGGDVPALQTGQSCTIQFRRDVLGAGANLPVSPTTHSFNGAETCVTGTLKKVTAEWFVIEFERKHSGKSSELWIPKGVVLMVEQ